MSLRDTLPLVRPGVSLAVMLGSIAGMVFYGLKYDLSYASPVLLISTALGSFLLCAGCSALNQVQEREQDAAMRRTAGRPIASGQLSPALGLTVAFVLIASGLLLYAAAGGLTLAAVGAVVVISYNGTYTPLKTRTPFALLAGGVAGALPPVTGWIAAGGDPFAPSILTLLGVFYLWQVPHFWMLAEKHREDYVRAGFKLTADCLPSGSRNRLMRLWVVAYFLGLAAFLLPTPLLSIGCLMIGLTTVAAMFAGRSRVAALLVDGSLPLALGATLLISV